MERRVSDSGHPHSRNRSELVKSVLLDCLKSIFFLVTATGLGLVFYNLGFTNANIIMVYILGALLTAIATSHQIYGLVTSVASVFVFNYFFTEPRFTMYAHEKGYPITFLVMFLTAYITGSFSLRYKRQARQSATNARRTKILFDTSQLLSKANGRQEIIHTTAEQIFKLLNRTFVLFENDHGALSAPYMYNSNHADTKEGFTEKELETAAWVLRNNKEASVVKSKESDPEYTYYPLHVNERVYGVVGINTDDDPLDASERDMLLSILGECALALENEKNAREKEAAAILAENERLRANLLRSISHDLRTPLTTISGNASNLISNGNYFTPETRQQIYTDIYNDAMWLYELVENLLYSTRIEEGRMTLHTSKELLSDIIDDAIAHFLPKADNHPISAEYEDDLLLVRADARLLVQVIINIIDNAVKYTPEGSAIHITTKKAGDMAEILISDTGDGIPDEEKDKIFDKFYHGSNKIADNRRSIGLGLYLCKAIVEAHNGEISVHDNTPSGAVFRLTVPMEEVAALE